VAVAGTAALAVVVRSVPVSRRADLPFEGDELRWVEAAESLRTAETLLLHMLGLLRGIEPELPATTAFTLPARDAADVLALWDEFVDVVEQLGPSRESLSAEDVDFRWHDLQRQAVVALVRGVADLRRAVTLMRCMGVTVGFAALAEMLRCTDAHESWEGMAVGHAIVSFRDADETIARVVTGMAGLSPETPFSSLTRQQVSQLASALERYAAEVPRHPRDRAPEHGKR